MKLHRLQLPLTPAAVRELQVGDQIILSGEIVTTAGLPTHGRIRDCIDQGRAPPFPLVGGTLFHLGSYSEETDQGLSIRYMNPTTSTRFNRFMPDFIRKLDLRLVGGKGGLDEASVAAMQETGCAYLGFLGGGCPLISQAIEAIEEVGWSDLVAHYRLVRMRVRNLGPLTVCIDSHGQSLFGQAQHLAQGRMEGILARLEQRRQAAAVSAAAAPD